MRELDRYLERATRSVFGRRRRLIREELHANLVQQALELQLEGLSAEAAMLRALELFGAPGQVSRGMLRVHTLPLALTGFLVISGVGGVAYGLSTQVRAAQTRPVQSKSVPASSTAPQRTKPPSPPVQ